MAAHSGLVYLFNNNKNDNKLHFQMSVEIRFVRILFCSFAITIFAILERIRVRVCDNQKRLPDKNNTLTCMHSTHHTPSKSIWLHRNTGNRQQAANCADGVYKRKPGE